MAWNRSTSRFLCRKPKLVRVKIRAKRIMAEMPRMVVAARVEMTTLFTVIS